MAQKRDRPPDRDSAAPEPDTPKPRKPPKVTPPTRTRDWKPTFLTALRSVPNINLAARQAEINRRTVFRARKADPAFAEAMAEAIEDACDRFEGEVAKRILSGSDQVRTRERVDPKTGEVLERTVETIKDPESRLLIDYLRALRPEKWQPNYDPRRLAALLAPFLNQQAHPGRLPEPEPGPVAPEADGGRAGPGRGDAGR